MAEDKADKSNSDDNKSVAQHAFGGAAKEFGKEITPIGKELGVVTSKVARLLISGLDKSVYGIDRIAEWMRDEVSARLRNVAQDKIVEPNPRIAVPATQALLYSMDDEHIREMFANLLAADMNSDRKQLAHPAFVEIIKQMTPAEARLLQAVLNRRQVEYRIRAGGPARFLEVGLRYSFEMPSLDVDACSRAISNLERLGVLELNEEHWISEIIDNQERGFIAEFAPQKQELSRPDVKQHLGLGEATDVPIFSSRRGVHITALGNSFAAVCMVERT